jgi:ClpP class serine protease
MTMMLLKADVAAEYRHAHRSGTVAYSRDRAQAFRVEAAARSGAERVMTVSGDVAQISVTGLLVKQPDLIAEMLGYEQTSYSDVQDALALADSSPNVKRIVLSIDSPGGYVSGLFELLQALVAVNKPIIANASCACSAAYAIAATASKIRAVTPASEFGSIGVAKSIWVDEHEVHIASTDAPNKRPNVATEAGQDAVRSELDQIHALFVESIARGRKTTTAKVNADFGRGGVVLALDARKRGMIDSIIDPPGSKSKASATADPRADLAGYLTQRCRPMLGESDLEFAERACKVMDQARAVRDRGGSVADFNALFDDGADAVTGTTSRPRSMLDVFASDLPGNPDEPGDLGDQVAARLQARRGARAQPRDAGDRMADLLGWPLDPLDPSTHATRKR